MSTVSDWASTHSDTGDPVAITDDPTNPEYLDEAAVRHEMSRVFDVCHDCRLCIDHCTSFPTLFGMIDALPRPDTGLMTPAQQDQVVDECFLCTACTVTCPYTPDLHVLQIDVPALVLRARAMRHRAGHTSFRRRAALRILTRTELVGRVGTAAPAFWNALVGAPAGSRRRRVLTVLTGASSVRRLPPFAAQRFSDWYASHGSSSECPSAAPTGRADAVTVFPTCLVEYHAPEIGIDLVRMLDHLGVACTTSTGCCGAPWLYAGDVDRFAAVAGRTVTRLAEAARGHDGPIVVGQSACAHVLRHRIPTHVRGADAELVAGRTLDIAEYLAASDLVPHRDVDPTVGADAPPTIVVHGATADDRPTSATIALLAAAGADVALVDRAAGLDGTWGLRADHDEVASAMTDRLVDAISAAVGDVDERVVVGDDVMANLAIADRTGTNPLHPVQLVAAARSTGER